MGSWISATVWNLLPFKGDFSFGKSQKSQGTKSGLLGGLSHLGKSMFCQKNLHNMMYERVRCHDEAANHQLPTAAAFWIIQIVSVEESSSLMQNLMQIRCSALSVILNATATQYTCSLHSVYNPHWLEQWSHHCSCMHILVHSPWLPGYINVLQTILIILTMAALFPDILHL